MSGSEQPSRESQAVPGDALVGRGRELDELVGALADAGAGRGSLFLVTGEPGVGKTRLVDALSARARDVGALVLWGRCWESGGAPPYWPWGEGICAYVRAPGMGGVTPGIGPPAAP